MKNINKDLLKVLFFIGFAIILGAEAVLISIAINIFYEVITGWIINIAWNIVICVVVFGLYIAFMREIWIWLHQEGC